MQQSINTKAKHAAYLRCWTVVQTGSIRGENRLHSKTEAPGMALRDSLIFSSRLSQMMYRKTRLHDEKWVKSREVRLQDAS